MTYVPNESDFPTPQRPKRTGNPDKVTNSPYKILQGIHGEDFAGYPATSAAQRIGVLCNVANKSESEYVYRTMIRLGLTNSGDIRNTARGNAVKHLPPRAGKYPLPKWNFTASVATYIKKVYAVVIKEAKAEAKANAEASESATS